MKIKEITDIIERFAPLSLQESYDNAGLIVGRPDDDVQGVLLAVDVTDAVMDEAERRGCDLIVTHHPVVFHALKRFNSDGYVQRAVERAIRCGIALYACHTNLDSAPGGMSWRLAGLLGIGNLRVLQPHREQQEAGFGVVGELPAEEQTLAFLRRVKETLRVGALRMSRQATEHVRRVALCTGAGASLMEEAARSGAEVYLTADLKYNDFMTPDGRFTAVDVGHYESEYCAIDLLFDILSENLLTFAVRRSESSRNPITYLV